MLESKLSGWKEKKSVILHKGDGRGKRARSDY